MKYSLPIKIKSKKIKDVKKYIAECEYEIAERKVIQNMTEWYLENMTDLPKLRKEVQDAILR